MRLGGTPAAARLLTVAIFLVLVGLGGLLALQGGTLLVSSIVNHTDPSLIPNVVLDPARPCARAGRTGTGSGTRTRTRACPGTCSGTRSAN